MKYQLNKIPSTGCDVEVTLPPNALKIGLKPGDLLADSFVEPLTASLHLEKVKHNVSLHGTANVTLEPLCDRCGEKYRLPLGLALNLTCVPRSVTSDEDDDLYPYEGQELDLGEILRTQLLVQLPMSFFCRPDCQGLCPHCAGNLNLGPCDCSAAQAH